MRRTTYFLLALLFALVVSSAAAQMPRITGIAYAHVSLSIQFGDGNAPTYTLDGAIYPRVEFQSQCMGQRCASGMATPLGYWYDPYDFSVNPVAHTEEIMHIRQWEALGPGFLLAYFGTFGEPFEPYPTRNLVAFAASQPRSEWYDLDRMWMPSADMEKTYPQLRVSWGGQAPEPNVTFFPGYTELVTDVITTVRGEAAPALTPDEPVIASLTPEPTYYAMPGFDPLEEEFIASTE